MEVTQPICPGIGHRENGKRSTCFSFNFLLPVWGEGYVGKFLHTVLPTLMAPGNIPHLSRENDLLISFLTRKDDISTLENDRGIEDLSRYADVKYVLIDDVIRYNNDFNQGNAVFTLNIALQRGFEAEDRDHTEVNFILLNGDVLFADGCCRALESIVRKGFRVIMEAVFRANPETLLPALEDYREGGAIVMPPRTLVRLGLDNLHPASAQHIWTNPDASSSIANHYYWVVPGKGLLGRCFLMHPFLIRPTRRLDSFDGFVDYAAVPASGVLRDQIYFLQDSDEFFRLEIADAGYETEHVVLEPYSIERAADHLATWTTELHRSYAHHPIRYVIDSPDAIAWESVESESQVVIDAILERLRTSPAQEPFGHPYWGNSTSKFEAWRGKEGIGKPIVLKSLHGVRFATTDARLYHLPPAPALSRMRTEDDALREAVRTVAGRCLVLASTALAPSTLALLEGGGRTLEVKLFDHVWSMNNSDAGARPPYAAILMLAPSEPEQLRHEARTFHSCLAPGGTLILKVHFLDQATMDATAPTLSTTAAAIEALSPWFWRFETALVGGLEQAVRSRFGNSATRALLTRLARHIDQAVQGRSFYNSAIIQATRIAFEEG